MVSLTEASLLNQTPPGEGGGVVPTCEAAIALLSMYTIIVYTSSLYSSDCSISVLTLSASTSSSISPSNCLRTSSFSCKLSFSCDSFIASASPSRRALALLIIRVADARCGHASFLPALQPRWASTGVRGFST